MQAVLPSAEAASGTQAGPSPRPAAGGGNAKQDKERLRKERQRQRKIEVAMKALHWAIEAMAEHGARCVPSLMRRRAFKITSFTPERRTDGCVVCGVVLEQ